MAVLLPLLILPLLACVALVPGRRGAATARVITCAFAFASLLAGTGSLLPSELRAWASQGPSQSLFVSLSTGLAMGGLGLWSRRGWVWHLTAIPLLVGLPAVFWGSLRPLPLVLGTVLGAMPLLVAGLAPRVLPRAAADAGRLQLVNICVATLACVAVASRSLVAITLVPLLPWIAQEQRATNTPRRLALPALAFLILVALAAYAISLTGSPSMALTSFGFAAPLGGAAERVVGAAVLAAGIGMVAPWPFHRFGPGVTLVPAAALMVYLIAGSIAPLGVAGWLPLAALLLVPSALAAAWRGYWANALGSLALLAVPRPGWFGLGLIVLVVAAAFALSEGNRRPPNRISFPDRAPTAVLSALALALATAAVLAHEVVLGALLAAGMATAVARPTGTPPSS